MKLQRISTILRAGALAALFVVGTSAAANAATLVTFSTTGDFGGGSSFVVFGPDGQGDTATLTYTGNPGGIALIPEGATTNANFGSFDLVFNGPNVLFNQAVNQPFALTITQTLPSAGADAFTGTVLGTFVGTNVTDLHIDWSVTEFQIGNVTYSLPLTRILTDPTNNAGVTTVEGQISVSAVPEPATMMLLGTGLLAAFRARRKVV